MAFAAQNEHDLDISSMERQFQRVDLTLFGRFMLANRQEFPCQVINMSPGSAALVAPPSTASLLPDESNAVVSMFPDPRASAP